MGLLLSGGGDPENVVPLDAFFVRRIDLRKPVLYIPVAMEPHVFTYDECFAWFKETYNPYGVHAVELCTDLRPAMDLSEYAAVFIGGGNTFKLLKAMKESRFDEQLIAYCRGGGFIYGGSAGAIIFGAAILTGTAHGDRNTVGLTDLSGLNLAGGRDIWCHYSPADDELIRAYENDLYILYEESGLFIEGDKIESVGKMFLRKSEI